MQKLFDEIDYNDIYKNISISIRLFMPLLMKCIILKKHKIYW